MDELKSLNLSEKDFKLIIDGLDALPDKSLAGEMLGELFTGMLMKDGDPKKDEMDKLRLARQAKKETEKELLKEEIRILQGKLLTLKRFLMQQNALETTVNIINHVK